MNVSHITGGTNKQGYYGVFRAFSISVTQMLEVCRWFTENNVDDHCRIAPADYLGKSDTMSDYYIYITDIDAAALFRLTWV